MGQDLKRLAELSALTEAEFQSHQAKMMRLRRRETEIRDQMRAIEEDRARQLATLHPADPAVRAGAVLSWETWVEQRQRGLMIDLARLRVQMEAAREELTRSFGRNAALRKTIRRYEARARQDTQRRQDAGS